MMATSKHESESFIALQVYLKILANFGEIHNGWDT